MSARAAAPSTMDFGPDDGSCDGRPFAPPEAYEGDPEAQLRRPPARAAAPADQVAPRATRWPEPVNLFAEFAAPAYQPTEFPPELSAWPAAYARLSGIDQNITLTAALAAAATALSDDFQIEADSRTGWRQAARLWVITIGRPGSGKTPAQKEMMAPLWAIAGEERKRWQAACDALAEDEPRPPEPQVLVGDTTVEALSGILCTHPQGIGIVADEFESWLGSMDMYRKGGAASRDRGEWLRLFDGGPHSVVRVSRGSVFVPNWGVSILTASTPAAMSKMARALPEDGLIQRFIPAIARRQSLRVEHVHGAEGLRTAYRELIHRLYAARARSNGGVVSLSHEAQTAFAKWHQGNHTQLAAAGSLSPAVEGHIAKHPTLLLRLALLFHAVKVVSFEAHEARNLCAWPVTADTIGLAAALLRRIGQHAVALFVGLEGEGGSYGLAKDVARYVLAAGGASTTRRDIQRHVRAFRGAEPHQQTAAMQIMEDCGWLSATDTGYAKAYPTRFDINPKVAAQFGRLAERERARRATVREMIREAVEDRRIDDIDDKAAPEDVE